VVAIGRRVAVGDVDVVRPADHIGVAEALAHLTGLGHRHIAFVDGGRGVVAASRRRGYRDGMRRAGLADQIRIIAGDHTEEGGIRAGRLIAAGTDRPTAVVASNDRCAVGVMDAFVRAGIEVPGQISIVAIDRGASGDSVSGVAQFTAKDGAQWRVVMDRVQTKDIPYNPRFGGVIMGLFYHGASNVHTPLVPTIQSSVALWSVAHLYKNDQLVTDNAMVHVMLLSRTRRTSDWALDCWDCSERPVEELQLQVTSAPGSPPFDTPGGFLFVNWERSSGKAVAL